MQRGKRSRSTVAQGAAILAGLLLNACDTDFEKPSTVQGVRVLAVRSDPGSGKAGASVKLDLLAVDGGVKPEAAPRKLQLLWLAGCHNPPTRQFYACFPLLNLAANLASPRVIDTPATRFPAGLFKITSFDLSDTSDGGFEFVVPQDILKTAPRATADPIHFGVSYAFFALCAGELRTKPEITDGVPFECYTPGATEPLGYRDFVTGFATVYTYEGVINQNPVLGGLRFQGADLRKLAKACSSDDDCADAVASDAGFTAACDALGTCAPAVVPCHGDDCPKFLVEPDVDSSVAEQLPEGGDEVVWASFYATSGSFDSDAQLINDRHLGFLGNRGALFKAPDSAGSVDVWVTVNDQRGGATWQSFKVLVRE